LELESEKSADDKVPVSALCALLSGKNPHAIIENIVFHELKNPAGLQSVEP
jgi:hypothetical protein